MSKYFLSVCSVIRNEAQYFSEWIAFHRLMGVERFYIYHNAMPGEDMETRNVIWAELNRGGDIELIVWGGDGQQCTCFQHCLTVFGEKSEWIAFIDTDEFLWSPIERNTHTSLVGALLMMPTYHRPQLAGIAVHWYLFGANGHKEKTDGLVIERFTRRAALPNDHVKSIVRPVGIKSAGPNPHAFLPKPGFYITDERGMELPRDYANSTTGEASILRINHYHSKSFEEYFSRKSSAPDCNSGLKLTPERIQICFDAHDVNEVEDTLLRDRYAAAIKESTKLENIVWD